MTKLILPQEPKLVADKKEPAPQVSKYADYVVSRGAQILLPFNVGDAMVSFDSRWKLAKMIDDAIMAAIEDFVEEQAEEPEHDLNAGIT